MKIFPVALTFVTGLIPGIVLAESIDQTPEVVNLNEKLADAPYYDRTARAGMGSRGAELIGEDGWAWAITSLRHEKKIRAQIVLERGKIVHEYYRKDKYETRELAPGKNVSEHVHSVTKSFCAMIIAHMVEHPDYDIAFEDTLEKIFDDDNLWISVLSSPNKNDNRTVAEYNVNEMKKATLYNILAMSAGLDEERYRERIRQSYWDPTIPLFQYVYSSRAQELNEQLPVFIAGKETWPIKEDEVNWTPGGESLVDALAIYDMKEPFWEYFKEPPYKLSDSWNKGKYNYIAYSPLLSYIINATSGLMPSQYLEKYFMPYLGPGPETPSGEHTMTPWADEIWGWKKIDDGMEYGWSGMNITARGLAKFGQLILQGGSNGNGTQILPKHWTDELKSNSTYYHHHFYPQFQIWEGYNPEILCMDGFYGHIVCIHTKTQRIYVQLVEDDSECLYNENGPNLCQSGPKASLALAKKLFRLFSSDKHAFGAPQTALNPSPKTNAYKSEKVGKAKTGKTKKSKRELSE